MGWLEQFLQTLQANIDVGLGDAPRLVACAKQIAPPGWEVLPMPRLSNEQLATIEAQRLVGERPLPPKEVFNE